MPANQGMISVQVLGIPQAIANFERLKFAVQNRVNRKSCRAGIAPMRSRARASSLFRDRTGLLRRSLFVIDKTERSTGGSKALLMPRRGVEGTYRGKKVVPKNYAHVVEMGHRTAVHPGTLRTTTDWVLVRKGKTIFQIGRGKMLGIQHPRKPFVEARPFMNRAFNLSVFSSINLFEKKFELEVMREVAVFGNLRP